MDIVAGHKALGRRLHAPAIAIGNFDGVHLGHQRLFEEVRRRAAARGGESVVLTFAPHPAKVLAARFAPPLITTLSRKRELIAAAGIDVTVEEPFTPELASWSPLEFVERVLVDALGAVDVCIGYDFTFGKERAGGTQRLVELGGQHGFAVTVLEPVTADGMTCSSTKVREFVVEGRVEGARVLLGRPHEIEGVVVAGAGRGRTIGVPTANLRPDTELLPALGVYAGHAQLIVDGESDSSERAVAPARRWKAAINVGHNPTFGGSALSIEAHLIDYDGPSLLGARLRLELVRRLRAEQRFPSVDALVEQIRKDIEQARAPA